MDYNTENRQAMVANIGKVKRKSTVGKTLSLLLACGLVSGSAGFGGAMLYQYVSGDTLETQILYTTPQLEVQKMVTYSTSDIALPDLYTMNVNSTVGITISTTVNFFGQPTTSAASGSGFVISSDGYVVTNYHVIEEATKNTDSPIEVKFQNGDVYQAKVVGYESDNDLAVLKIDATGLTPVVMGDSDALVVGETVVAIGNPLGELDFTFTNGIISAKDRLINTGDNQTMNMLQTNTAINPGNSGGPLFDGQGALIGINTAKYANSSDGTSVEGLGFAIPINDVKQMIVDIIEHGYVTGKPYIGVVVENVPADAQAFGIAAGAYVRSVAEGGAAQKAGIRAGDIITVIGETTVDSWSALTAALNGYRAGDLVEFTVVRDHQTIKVDVVLDEKNEETEKNNPIEETTESQGNNYGSGNNGSYGSGGNSNGSYGSGGNSNSYDNWDMFQYFFGNMFP